MESDVRKKKKNRIEIGLIDETQENKEVDVLCITNKGMEDICRDEIQRIVVAKDSTVVSPESSIKIVDGAVRLSLPLHDALGIGYATRSATRVMAVCWSGNAKILFETFSEINVSWNLWIGKDVTFSVVVDKDVSEPTSPEITKLIANCIRSNAQGVHEYTAGKVVVLVYIRNGNAHVGIDLVSFDLGRRNYRVFLGTSSLRGNIAYALVQLSEFSKEMTLIDPHCKHGIIPIEAALVACNASPQYYAKSLFGFRNLLPCAGFDTDELFSEWDKSAAFDTATKITALDVNFSLVQASRKNSQLAGVVKNIAFSRKEVEWLDLKFGKNTVDCVVTYPFQLSQHKSESGFRRLCKDFFSQCAFILNVKGHVVIIMRQGHDIVKKEAIQAGFLCTHERSIWQGQEELPVLVFVKDKMKKIEL